MKLTEEHIDKKVRLTSWGNSRYFIPKFFSKSKVMCGLFVYGLNEDGAADKYYSDREDWELVQEIPEDQAWVVPGKTYRLKNGRVFTPHSYCFPRMFWRGVDNKGNEDYWCMFNQLEWEEVKPKKTVKMAPALGMTEDHQEYGITGVVFTSEQAAKSWLNEYFVKWPANENSWVEVEVDCE